MKKQILLEVNRTREIMGLKPINIINEQLANYFKTLMKSASPEIRADLKNLIEPFASAEGKTIDNAFSEFETEFANASKQGDAEMDVVINKYFKTESEILDEIISKMISQEPKEFAKSASKSILPSNLDRTLRYYSGTGNVTKENLQTIKDLYDDVKSELNYLDISDEFTLQAKESITSEYLNSLKTKIDDVEKSIKSETEASAKSEAEAQTKAQFKPTINTIDDWYNKVYLVDVKKAGKKPISKEEFKQQAASIGAKFKDLDETQIVQELINAAKDKKNFLQWFNSTFKKSGGVGDAAEVAADGAIKVTKKGVEWIKTIGGIGLGGLAVVAILLAIFKPDFYVDMGQRYREAGAKYTETYNILVSRLGDNFTELPEEVKQFIGREFTAEQAKVNQSSPYIKDIRFKPNSQTEAGLLEVVMSDNNSTKFETTDNQTFNKVGDKLINTNKTEQEFKDAAKQIGGYDVKKSFEKKSDTKYWGTDEDDTQSTIEWNGSEFIVKAGHN